MPNRRSLDYVTKDYEGFRQLMLDLIPQYAPEWTDTSQSNSKAGISTVNGAVMLPR